ncbi:hypothetical protein Q8W71_29205 [Methylobacterium sp. NEAU 140]|nr:hypothetical protein [Methylobacterium sp. NEAU 140]MDP4026689.1 hypothetical protein [Methylobacterium sp. NEAU 140]
MTINPTHPFTLEIFPPKSPGGLYHWTIRKHGKLAQRSDRDLPSEAKAHENGMKQIERFLTDRG